MNSTTKMTLAVTVLFAGVVLLCSCQTCRTKDPLISHASFNAIPLANCVEQLNAQIGEAKGQGEVDSIVVDTTPASIEWVDVSAANSNAAERLVGDYTTRVREWEHFVGTNLITFKSGWVSMHNVLTILAAASGGATDTVGNRAIVRYGARELQLREHAHDGWNGLMEERRFPENGDNLADLFGHTYWGNNRMTRYVPETDVVLVLGTFSQQKEFRELVSEFQTKAANDRGSPNTASHGTALPRRP